MIPTVVAMLKAPTPGTVKTRLAEALGAEGAAAVYRWLVERQLAALPTEWRVEVHGAPAAELGGLARWLGPRPRYEPQVEGDLGARLTAAVAGAFGRGAEAVLCIGGDCPGLGEAGLREAARVLEDVEAVLGPALDGGYYLLGLRRPCAGVFDGVAWSTAEVAEQTRRRLAAAGLRWRELAVLEDVDDAASWRRAQAVWPGRV